MSAHRNRRNRRSIRMPGHDYGRPGFYFVTICTSDRAPLFGRIAARRVVLSEAGRIAADEWQRGEQLRDEVVLDEWIVMPDHFHGLVALTDAGNPAEGDAERPFRSPTRTLGALVRGFKAATTRRIRRELGARDLIVWQRNYYECVVRDARHLRNVRRYIRENPRRASRRGS